jgi:hypothetical protein
MKGTTCSRPETRELEQTVELIAAALEDFLAERPRTVVCEDGRVLCDLREAFIVLKADESLRPRAARAGLLSPRPLATSTEPRQPPWASLSDTGTSADGLANRLDPI